jgi:imidazolonepropionase-like amidohydrolase
MGRRSRVVRAALAVFAFVVSAERARAAHNSFAIRNVRVFDGERVVPRANLIVRDGKIAALGRSVKIPAALLTIDGAGKTLLPGLIDSHVHVFPGAQADALRFGVTTELDMFNLTHEFARWRAQRQSFARVTDADTWTAGTGVSAPGGHPSGTMPGSSGIPTLANAADSRAFVAARVAEGSDYVKIMMEDNSFLTPDHLIPTLSREAVCASVKAAHDLGKMAIVHVSRQRDARTAILCGADGLAHLFADEVVQPDFVKLAREHHVFVETTMSVVAAGSSMPLPAQAYASPAIAPWLSAGQRQMIAGGFFGPARPHGIENVLRSARILHAAGIPLLAGTDAPNPGAPHGAGLHAELRLLTLAGFSPIEALRSATSLPARTFHLSDRGRIAPGYRADLLLVRGNPTRDIGATAAIDRIWKNGFEVTRAAASK